MNFDFYKKFKPINYKKINKNKKLSELFKEYEENVDDGSKKNDE